MSLYKIPLIIFLTRDFVSALTPPQPRPSKEERGRTTAIDDPRWRQLRITWMQAGQLILATVETLSIIFHHLPASIKSIITQNLTVVGLPDALPQLRTSKLQLLGAVIWLVGTRLRFSAFAKLGRFFRFEISIQSAHKLITRGPYAYVRHPAYTGLLLMCLGWVCYQFAPGSWLHESSMLESLSGVFLVSIYVGGGPLFMLIVTLGRMWKEEDMLQAKFEREWEEWAEKVPCRLIPGIY